MKFLPLLLLSTVLLLSTTDAGACSTCQCGDPTLTLLGSEKPFSGRFRLSGDFRYRTEEVGTPNLDREVFKESRFSLSSAYAPKDWVFLGLTVPFVSKEMTEFGEPSLRTNNLGDVELKTKWFLSSSPRGSKHLYGILAGMRFPTAPYVKDSLGTPLDFHAQPGMGAWGGSGGAWYNYFQFPFSLYLSSFGSFASEGHQSVQAGNAWLNSIRGQVQTGFKVAFQLGIDTLLSARDRTAGSPEPNTGGFLLTVSPGIVWSPVMDWLFNASVQIPSLNALYDEHDMGVTFLTGITYDFSI